MLLLAVGDSTELQVGWEILVSTGSRELRFRLARLEATAGALRVALEASGGVTTWDESQLRAAQHSLTHRVALIQGPPGTGKTFIGCKLWLACLNICGGNHKESVGSIVYYGVLQVVMCRIGLGEG